MEAEHKELERSLMVLGFQLNIKGVKMVSSLLLIMLTMSSSSLGSLSQISHTTDDSDSVQKDQRRGRNNNVLDSLSAQAVFQLESSSTFLEGSGKSMDTTALQKIINLTDSPMEPEKASDEKSSGSASSSVTTPALTLYQAEAHYEGEHRTNASTIVFTHSSVHIMSEEAHSHIPHEDQPITDGLSSSVDSPHFPVQNHVFVSVTNQNQSRPRGPCVLGLSPCVLPNINGTSLHWDDMRRTLTFAWELHVFGSASLFILMAVLAVMGVVGAFTLPYPICDALTLANSLLILGGTLRGVLLLLDPYGTHQILSHATLAALHNAPLQLLLWAQVSLSLVTLRRLNLLIFPLKLQRPWVVGGLAISNCIPLLVADLFSPILSRTLPLLLQTLTLCWGLPFCLGIFTKSCSKLHPFLRSPIPQWVPSQRIEKCAKRVTSVCAFLGVICCSLHIYSLLWLYGLLGNWRRFGWGWWLSQFWARILELSWGFSLLVLGSWIFWMPSRGHSRGYHGRETKETSLWGSILTCVRKGHLKKTEQSLKDMMPSNWTKYNLSRAGFSNPIMCPYDDLTPTTVPKYRPDPVCNSSLDCQAALPWQKVGEYECVLSLIEFDIRPPSPINLRRSIDNALHRGQLVTGGLFIHSPPPTWTCSVSRDGGVTAFLPAYTGNGCTLDTESLELPSATTDSTGGDGSPATANQRQDSNPAFSQVMHQHDWPNDDVTNL